MTDDPSTSRTGRGASPYIPVGAEIGPYRVEAYLDRGGMASVYEATDLRLNRTVALKVLAQEISASADFRERFIRESRFAASLDHPNIVPIYEAGEADGLLYIAMRYVRGPNLAELLREHGALDPKRALAILTPVADALDTAHNAGLVHRDVKPANILVTAIVGREGHEHVYLTDFGLTKRTSALTKLTATGNFIGTMAYIAPEQIRGEPLDARTDLYALGCVAYECLTGVPPFVRDDQAALLWAHLNDPPVAVSRHRIALLAADTVMARVMAKNPSDRFQTCDQFTQALSDVLLTGRHSPSNVLTVAAPRLQSPSSVGHSAWLVGASASSAHPSSSSEHPSASSAHPSEPSASWTLPSASSAHPSEPAASWALPSASSAHPSNPSASSDASPVKSPASDPPPNVAPGSQNRAGEDLSPSAAAPADASGDRPRSALGQPSGSDEPPVSPPPTGGSGPSVGALPPPRPPKALEGRGSSKRRSRPPVGEPSMVIPKQRRFRRRSVLTVLAAVLAVAATLVVVVIFRPTTRLEAGTGRPTGAVDTLTATSSAATSAETPTSMSAESTPSASAASTTAQTTQLNIVPSVAIPTVDGSPIDVGKPAGFAAISPDGRLVYIANREADKVTVVDTTSNQRVAEITISAGPPWFIAFTPDGSRAYVSIYNSDKTINRVAVLDTRTTKLLGTIDVDQKPYALAVSNDQKSVYVPSHDTGTIDIIDIATNTLTNRISVAPNPHWVTFTPDGKTAYIANHESNVLSVLDVASGAVVKTIPVGTSPHSVAVSPDGKQVTVVCYDSSDLYFIDTATNEVLGKVDVGTRPQDVSYAADGHYLYTANVDGNSVSVVDTETMAVTATITTPSPSSVAVLPNGRKAYVTNLDAGTITMLDTAH